MRRETTDLIGSGLLLAALVTGTFATLAPQAGASVAPPGAVSSSSASIERGRSLFYAKGCVGCHMKQGESGRMSVGPDLTGLAQRADLREPGMSAQPYVRESIRTPTAFVVPGFQPVMPDFGLTDDEIATLTAFLLGTP